MTATLSVSAQITIPETLVDTIKIVNHQVEDNVEKWVDIYYVFGTMVADEFVQYFDPVTALGIPVQRVKLENGSHPLALGTALRKCPTCGKWFRLETVCDVTECQEVELDHYDGFTRFMEWGADDPNHYDSPPACPCEVMKRAMYEFLIAEHVPDPDDDWPNLRPLVDATDWE